MADFTPYGDLPSHETISDAEWQAKYGEFQTQTQQFATIYNRLLFAAQNANLQNYPVLYNELQSVINRGAVLKGTIVNLASKIEGAESWLKNAVGLSGMGIAPVVYVVSAVTIAACTAAITKWVSDAYIVSKKIDEMQGLIDKGYTPEAAAAMVSQATGLAGLFQNPVMQWVMIGAAVFVVLPMLTKSRGE